ncbi:hypothetical protein [Streptomyces sp. TRM68367]|uniref:hypothetical protein n=1 Tax=Streptomyces sp. TRM68367 TaxID=2758415 RepID=UPI00165A6DF9|nr:hypothetical protein [Streptomyces sp. TRM68367]MBC9731140.1 hypothetical protein [Streptomyces sp. TRM68367]
MTEVVVLPGLPADGGAGGDRVPVDEDFDGADVALEVPGVAVCLDQLVRADLDVMLSRFC